MCVERANVRHNVNNNNNNILVLYSAIPRNDDLYSDWLDHVICEKCHILREKQFEDCENGCNTLKLCLEWKHFFWQNCLNSLWDDYELIWYDRTSKVKRRCALSCRLTYHSQNQNRFKNKMLLTLFDVTHETNHLFWLSDPFDDGERAQLRALYFLADC